MEPGRAVLCHASDRGAPCCSIGVAWLAPRNRSLFPGGVDKAQIEELRCCRNWHSEITPLNKRVGHARVALRANPPIGAEGAKLANEVVIGIGGIRARLPRARCAPLHPSLSHIVGRVERIDRL